MSPAAILTAPRRHATRTARRMVATVRGAYLRHLLAAAEQDEAAHLWHAEREPQLAQLAAQRAAELRIQLIDLEGTTCMHAETAPPPADAATELGANPPRRGAFTRLLDRLDRMAPAHIWLLVWLLGVVAVGIPMAALVAIVANAMRATA